MRRHLSVLALCLSLPFGWAGGQVAAQASGIATLDQEELLLQSLYGQRLLHEHEERQRDLARENREIEAELAEREAELTRQRVGMDPTAFRQLADTFNVTVQDHRARQIAKERAIYQRHDEDRQEFLQRCRELLIELMNQRGIHAVIDEKAVLISGSQIDLTADLVGVLDARMGDGTAGGSDPRPDAAAPAAGTGNAP